MLITPGPLGGAERVVLAGAEVVAGRSSGFELWVLRETRVPKYAEQFMQLAADRDIPTRSFDVRGRLDWRCWWQLRQSLRAARFTHVYAHGYKALIYACLSRHTGQALVATHHGATAHTLAVRFYERIERSLLRRCDHVFAVSHTMSAQLRSQGIPAQRVSVLENILRFQSDARPVRDGDRPGGRMLYAGRLSAEKGLDILLQALALLPDEEIWQLDVLGEGPQRQALEAQVAALSLQSRVRFYGYYEDIMHFMGKAEMLVMPSLREGMPLSLLEALGCGLPVVGTSVGGLSELIEDGVNGRLVTPNDSHALAQALQEVLRHQAEYRGRTEQQAKLIQQRFSAESWANHLLAHIERITPRDRDK